MRLCTAGSFQWDAGKQGAFITSLCRDTRGNVWIGTEDQGCYRLDPNAPKDTQYSHFTSANGLGDDDIYALTCDKAGRLWAGTLNHGVSVFNGKDWKTYGPLNGPLGSRVFALAVNPKDGGVWGATEAGLFRYQGGNWTYFTRTDGLPSDQANALAFASDGTLYVGTQCDGVAVGSPDDNYQSWRVIPGHSNTPPTATGLGLPSHLINCLLVTANDTVYAGTPAGLAESRDAGLTWSYRRGEDWKDKLAGLSPPVKPIEHPIQGDLLREDYVTCLSDDGVGHLLIGHWRQGLEIVNRRDWKRVFPGPKDNTPTDYVTALLSQPGGTALIGGYGGGLLQQPLPGFPAKPALSLTANASAPTALPAFPLLAKPPTLAELNAMLRVVSAAAPDKDELKPKVVALDDDWTTQGDWLGRYGRYWACLCAICSPQDYLWGAGWQPVNYSSRIGLNAKSGDSLRYWVQWLYTKNPRVLELPPTYLDSRVKKGLTMPENNRREAEIDDHGEDYPQTMDGPNVYTTLTVPRGLFYLSLYDFNKDVHDWTGNRYRDYRLSIRSHSSGAALSDISGFSEQPELAHGRIQTFWGGVWKRFLVRGPMELTIQVNRNNSFNTILPAVMLDLVDENPPPYLQTVDQWEAKQAQQEKMRQVLAVQPAHFHSVTSESEAANDLFNTLSQVQITNSVWYATNSRRYYQPLLVWFAMQAQQSSAQGNAHLQQHLATCYYQTGLYSQWENCQNRAGIVSAREIEKSLQWDASYDDRGMGYETIKVALSQRSQAKKKRNIVSVHRRLRTRNMNIS